MLGQSPRTLDLSQGVRWSGAEAAAPHQRALSLSGVVVGGSRSWRRVGAGVIQSRHSHIAAAGPWHTGKRGRAKDEVKKTSLDHRETNQWMLDDYVLSSRSGSVQERARPRLPSPPSSLGAPMPIHQPLGIRCIQVPLTAHGVGATPAQLRLHLEWLDLDGQRDPRLLPSPSLLCLIQRHSTRHPSQLPDTLTKTAWGQSTAIACLNGHFSHGSTPVAGTGAVLVQSGGQPPVCHSHKIPTARMPRPGAALEPLPQGYAAPIRMCSALPVRPIDPAPAFLSDPPPPLSLPSNPT